MKQVYRLFCLLSFLAFAATAFANTVQIHGYVTFTNGAAANNWPVTIMPDSNSTGSSCFGAHTVYTNANGYYFDSLSCPNTIVRVIVSTHDCNGAVITHDPQVNPNGVAESNFTVCMPGTAVCNASFTSTVSGHAVYFTNTSTIPPPSTVYQYYWSFGDGSTSTVANPVHTYANAGTYTVILYIATTGSCSDSASATITIAANTTCNAEFYTQVGNATVYFSSGSSTTSPGDSIVERHWSFGDGSTLGGNVVNPYHVYPSGGVYTACLSITSASGCHDSVCKTVSVTVAPTCHAQFSDSISGHYVYFYSGMSTTGTGDSIYARLWTFGDGSSLSGNVVNPYHIYANNGTYTVCLKMATSHGCYDSICKTVTIVNNTTTCSAYFNYTSSGNVYTLQSYSQAGANDSIVSYIWHFGNGDSLTGHNPAPVHTYMPGTYNVCLKIVTALGCVHDFCRSITVAADSSCHAAFTSTPSTANNHLIYFNSSTSVPATAIITRTWYFGDGDSLTGNVISPYHTYANAGTYNACLVISTSTGCRSYICHSVTIANPVTCHAAFEDSIANNMAYFYSGQSTTGSGDSIIEHHWSWGDGTALNGNAVNAYHIYPNNGTYTVCLRITSASGCHDSTCKTIVIGRDSACHAAFTYTAAQTNPHNIYFNGTSSVPANGIISWKWKFGDGDSAVTTTGAAYHVYANAGTYTACLFITTATGCTSDVCHSVTITNPSTTCHAAFEDSVVGTTGHFYSGQSTAGAGDSIIERNWSFGDGTGLGGNVVNPTHTYPATTGTYTYMVCLKTHTALGCIDSVCKPVIIYNPQTNCLAAFTYNAGAAGTFYFNAGNSHGTSSTDSIIRYLWVFGDGDTSMGGVNTVHTYAPGTYNVCLHIYTASGCSADHCMQITVNAPAPCNAAFYATQSPNSNMVTFHSGASTGSSVIITRTWTFGDGDTLTGNVVEPQHTYAAAGTYLVCLHITASNGCTSDTCISVVITQTTLHCAAHFTAILSPAVPPGNAILFNSSTSEAMQGDSIISQTWTFGDGTSSNDAIVSHNYNAPGTYHVCLTIHTALGCSSTLCQDVVVPVPAPCHANFTYTTFAPAIRFNSSSSQVGAGDSIVHRIWNFGDSTTLTGNQIDPSHVYSHIGIYNACLTIITANGCQNTYCAPVYVRTDTTEPIKIVSLYPNPVHGDRIIPVIWSKYNNVDAELSVYDVYGARKWMVHKILPQGYSTYTVPVNFLPAGPYIFKVRTTYGTKSRAFYKL